VATFEIKYNTGQDELLGSCTGQYMEAEDKENQSLVREYHL